MAPRDSPDPGECRPKLTGNTFFLLGAMHVLHCINVNLLKLYVSEMISGLLDKSPDDSAVARTIGLLLGLYALCEVCFSVVWPFTKKLE